MSSLRFALFRRARVVYSSDKSFGGLGETTSDVYLTESPVDFRFRLETLAAPNDENRLLEMMVSAPVALESPPVHSAMVSAGSTFRWSSIGAKHSEATVGERNWVHPSPRVFVSVQRLGTLRLEDSAAVLSVGLGALEQPEACRPVVASRRKESAVIDSGVCCPFEHPMRIGPEPEPRVAAAAAERSGVGPYIAGAIPR